MTRIASVSTLRLFYKRHQMNNTRDIDLALLRAFIAVVETGSFSAAGRAFEKTASAVFYQIHRLEETVNQKLLIRDRRKIKLSKDGHRFLSQAHALLQLNDQILNGKWRVRSSE